MNTAETDDAIALAYKQMSAHPEYLGDFVILKENQSLIFVRKDESGDLLVTLKEVYDLSKEKLNNFTEFDFEKSILLILVYISLMKIWQSLLKLHQYISYYITSVIRGII